MQPSIRYPDWDRRLLAGIDACHDRPFAWGRWDCCLFAADLVQAMTGWDPAEVLRGTYRTERGAIIVTANHGGIKRMISDLLDTQPQSPPTLGRGDVVLLHPLALMKMEQIGVCTGDAAVVASDKGVMYRPMSSALCGWRID